MKFSEIKRCDVCENQYSAYADACGACGDQHHATLLPASFFESEPKTVEPAQPVLMVQPVTASEPRKWSKRGR